MGNVAERLQIFNKESILILFQINYFPKGVHKLELFPYEESMLN